MRKALVAPFVVVGAGALIGLPATAAQEEGAAAAADGPTVTTVPNANRWDQTAVTVRVGEAVTWANPRSSNRDHDLAFGPEPNPTPHVAVHRGWTYSREFTEAEVGQTIRFVCIRHKAAGMEGTVTVVPGGAPTPTPTPTDTPTPAPTETPIATPTPTPTPTAAPAVIRGLSVRSTFCARRSRTCPRPGVTVRLDLSAPAAVSGTLDRQARGYRRFGTVDLGRLPAGRRLVQLRLAGGKAIGAGRYRLRLQVGLSNWTATFRVR